jgi:hypothetical protein
MIEYVSQMRAHPLNNTLSVNNVRKTILEISRPIAEISMAIQRNINEIKIKKDEEIGLNASKKELEEKLYIPSVKVELMSLDYPTTVCAGAKCVQDVPFDGVVHKHFVKRCHEPCQILAEHNAVNCVALQHCWAFRFSSNCSECGCPWNVHMHITYMTKQVSTRIVDKGVQLLLNSNDEQKSKIEQFRAILQAEADALEQDKQQMAKVNAACACFLKKNAIVPYNDAVIAYLDHIISVEEARPTSDDRTKKLTGLHSLYKVYSTELQTLQKEIAHTDSYNADSLNPREIQRQIQSLYTLPRGGKMLKDAMDSVGKHNQKALILSEKVIEVDGSCFLHQPGAK